MGKQHELLAVEEDLRGTAKRILLETENTFNKKDSHFVEKIVEFQPLTEGAPAIEEGRIPMVTTVNDKLGYMAQSVGNYLDAFLQKEETNTVAKADIKLDNGEVLIPNVPVCALLGLQTELKRIHSVYSALPTLEPTMVWNQDTDSGVGIQLSKDSKVRTKKIVKPFVLAEATPQHKAQVEKVSEDVPTGTLHTFTRSSKLTPARKSILLGRVDELSRAVKSARMRANDVEHKTTKIGDKLFGYINA